MKKLTLISLVIFQFAFVNAQPYQSIFGDSTTSWNICQDAEGLIIDSVFTFNDTIINGYNYKILNSYFGFTGGGYIREDTISGKVWFWDKFDSTDVLIVDLTLAYEDTFYLLNFKSIDTIIFDTIIVDSVYYKDSIKYIRFNEIIQIWCAVSFGQKKISFIEGIGPNYSVTRPFAPYNILLCSAKDGNQVYYNADFPCNAQIIGGGIDEISYNKNYSIIFPHPVTLSSILKFDNSNHQEIKFTLYDIVGNKIEEISTNKNEITLNSFDKNPGIYFYRLSSDNRSINGKVIIIK